METHSPAHIWTGLIIGLGFLAVALLAPLLCILVGALIGIAISCWALLSIMDAYTLWRRERAFLRAGERDPS